MIIYNKKIISLLIVLTMVLSAISCTVGDTPESSNEESQSITEGTPIETPEETPIETPSDTEENIYDLSHGKVWVYGEQVKTYEDMIRILELKENMGYGYYQIYYVGKCNSDRKKEIWKEYGLDGKHSSTKTFGEITFETFNMLGIDNYNALDLDAIIRLSNLEEIDMVLLFRLIPEGVNGIS